MKPRFSFRLVSATALLLISIGLLAVACGGSEETTTTEAVETTTTEAIDETTITEGDETTGTEDSVDESSGIVFDGLVDYPVTFTAVDMGYMEPVTVTADHPDLGTMEYEGVRLSDVFSYVGIQSEAATLVITAADGSTVEIPVTDISEDAIIATNADDTLSTVMPGLESEAWVDDVVAMELK